jgi:hypothetical protein
MSDVKRATVRCPIWGRKHFFVCLDPDGKCYIEVPCKSDRGAMERFSREYLLQLWADLEGQERMETVDRVPHD